MNPSTRETPVAAAKIAVERASRRGCSDAAMDASFGSATIPPRPPARRAFLRDAQHQAAKEARPRRRQGAVRESSLPLDDQDANAAARVGGRRGRRRCGGYRAPAARALARPRRGTGCDPQEQGGPPQVAGGAPRLGDRAGRARRGEARPPQALLRELAPRLSGSRDRDQRALQLQIARQPAASLDGQVEPREPDGREPELVNAEVPSVTERLLGRERMNLQPSCGLPSSQSLRRQGLAAPDPPDVVREQTGQPEELVAP